MTVHSTQEQAALALQRVGHRVSSILFDEFDKAFAIDEASMEASLLDPQTLGLSFSIINQEYTNKESKWSSLPHTVKLSREIAVAGAHRFLYINAPASNEEVQELIRKGLHLEGYFWLAQNRYEKKDFSEEEFNEYCQINKSEALRCQLDALRVDLEALGRLARQAFEDLTSKDKL